MKIAIIGSHNQFIIEDVDKVVVSWDGKSKGTTCNLELTLKSPLTISLPDND